MLSTWAKAQALEYWESREFGEQEHKPFLFFLARKLLHKAHVALGLDRCRAFFVSATPIEVKILKYFTSLDLPIMELFGQSECTGPHAINSIHAFKIGTVGRPMSGTETKLGDGDELCYRGRHIFAGYMVSIGSSHDTIPNEDVASFLSTIPCDIPQSHSFWSRVCRKKRTRRSTMKAGCILETW